MKSFAELHLFSATLEPSRTSSFDQHICTEQFSAPDSNRFSCEVNAAGDGGEECKDVNKAKNLASRSYVYGHGKDLYHTLGKDNKANLSASSSFGHHDFRHIRKHSGPFGGPLTSVSGQSFCKKFNRVPSIVSSNLYRRKVLGFDACEPTSPEVTCFGRIKSKEFNNNCGCKATKIDGLGADLQRGMYCDTKNQICGKRRKGRKKKEKAKRRFASADSKSLPSELAQTRREKTTTLAMSLSDMLENMRLVERGSSHHEPSVPPPNSLLLMRGCRRGGKDMDMGSGSDHEGFDTADITSPQVEVVVPPPNSLLLMRGCKIRRNFSEPLELLIERIKHIQGSVTSVNGDAQHVKKLKARTERHSSLLDLIDKEESTIDKGASTFMVSDYTSKAQGSDALDARSSSASNNNEMMNKLVKEKALQDCHSKATLWQRRAFGELSVIQVKLHTKMER